MTIPAVSWDETNPANTDFVGEGDDRIRELKAQIREIIDVDHQFNSSGQDVDNGRHTLIHLLKEAAAPVSGITDQGQLYSRDDGSTDIELFYTDNTGRETQLTRDGQAIGENTGTFGVGSATGDGLGYGTAALITAGESSASFVTETVLSCSIIVHIDDIVEVVLQGRMLENGQGDIDVELRPILTTGTATQILGQDADSFFWATNDDVNATIPESGASFHVTRLYKATLEETLTFKMEWRMLSGKTGFAISRTLMAKRIARDA